MTNYPLRTHIHIHTRSCFPRFLQSCPQSSRTQAATCKATFSFDLRSRSGLQGLPIDTAIAAPSACLQLVPHHFTAGNAARHFRAPVRWLEVIHIVKPQQPYRARDSMASSASADVAAQPVDSGGPTSTDTAAAAAASDGWYYLMEGQHLGPFSTEQLLGYYTTGYMAPSSLVWRQGRSEWLPLKDVPELVAALASAHSAAKAGASAISATNRDVGNATESSTDPAATQSVPPAPGRSETAPVVSAASVQQDPMAAFLGEIKTIEAENEAAGDAPGTPDEKSFVDDDGTAYEWDPVARRFAEVGAAKPAAAAAQAAAADAAFDQEQQTFAFEAEEIPAMPEAEDSEDDEAEAGPEGKVKHKADKRKLEDAIERENAKKARSKEEAEKKAQWFQLQQNSSVYVAGLPADATEAEMVATFTKCGVIKLDDERRPRIKIYKDEDGTGKGDGLVTYLKQPSVDLAIQILDGTPLRDGDSQTLTITQAKFEQKGKFVAKKQKAKQRKKRVLEKQEQSELGWGGFDDVAPAIRTTVVLRHMFHPDDFAADFALREQLEDDVTGEAAKLGTVESVKIYNTNPQGIVTVKFRMEDAAEECIKLMHGRFFGGRQLDAALWDGIEKFYVKPAKAKETADEEAARLEKYAAELEGGGA